MFVPLEWVQLILGILRTHKGDVLSYAGMDVGLLTSLAEDAHGVFTLLKTRPQMSL